MINKGFSTRIKITKLCHIYGTGQYNQYSLLNLQKKIWTKQAASYKDLVDKTFI